MATDPDIQAQIYEFFLTEAPDLLQAIEQDLLALLQGWNVELVNNLMRSAHTLKGSAASVERETIKTVAHHLEDVFKSLYNPEIELDQELGALLLQGYECLRLPVMAELSGTPCDEEFILEETATVFAQLQEKLGDFFGQEPTLPTSADLGFDVVGSIFQESVQQDLNHLAVTLAGGQPQVIRESFHNQAEFLVGMGESYGLPGLMEISAAAIAALERHPDQIVEVATIILEDLQRARDQVLAGDRTQGGDPSPELLELAGMQASTSLVDPGWDPLIAMAEASGVEDDGQDDPIHLQQSALDTLSALEDELTPPPVPQPQPASPADEEISAQEQDLFPAGALDLAMSELLSAATTQRQASASSPPDSAPPTGMDLAITDLLGTGSALAPSSSSTSSQSSHASAPPSPIDQVVQQIWAETPAFPASSVPPPSQPVPGKGSTETPPARNIRVDIELLSRLNHVIGELLINQNQQSLQTDQIHAAAQEAMAQLQRCFQRLNQVQDRANQRLLSSQYRQFGSPESTSDFDVLELDPYDELHLLLQRLHEEMAQLAEGVESFDLFVQQSRLHLKKQKRLLTNGQEDLLQARMVPLGQVFNRFPPVLQQLCTSHQKLVDLRLQGTQVLIDKVIAEKLYDPLLHLVRNAFDHGIEAIDLRRQRGKPDTGMILLQAYHQGNRTTIEIQDDGGGLNYDKIRQRAQERQLLSPGELATATPAQLAELLFQPGFSTADQVSQLSGRGVGLDVVRSQIQALQGTVEVISTPAQGTRFLIQIPLTLTTARLLVCQAQGISYALLTDAVEQIILPNAEQLLSQPLVGQQGLQPFLYWEEEEQQHLVPIRPLSDLIDYRYAPGRLKAQSLSSISPFPLQRKQDHGDPLILMQQGQQLFCLRVDQIMAEQDLVIKTLGRRPILPDYIQGYTVLGDGQQALVIDPQSLVAHHWKDGASSAIRTPQNALAQKEPVPAWLAADPAVLAAPEGDTPSRAASFLPAAETTILVIEDSVTQRQTVVLTLQKQGYRVIQAGHGLEGLEKLRRHPEIQVVVCDVEMPQMNGYEFLTACRQDPQLARLPVIMLTSRSGSKHRDRAFALGARGYLTKPCSSQELFSALGQLEAVR